LYFFKLYVFAVVGHRSRRLSFAFEKESKVAYYYCFNG